MKVLKHYPYRTGRVFVGISFPRELMRPFETALNKLAGTQIDNHTCFSFEDEHGSPKAVMFHDFMCIIGDRVEEKKW